MPEAQAILRSRGIAPADYKDALFDASGAGDVELLHLLIAAGVDVNEPYDEYGYRAVSCACYHGKSECTQLLMDVGADINVNDSLGSAILSGCIDLVKMLIKRGADVNSQASGVWTPLQCAVHEWEPEMVKILLAAGADTEWGVGNEDAPLILAVDEANEKMVRILLEAGANPNIEDDKLGKPLGIALNRNLHSIAELLIQFGARK